jgi:hypothetical protein
MKRVLEKNIILIILIIILISFMYIIWYSNRIKPATLSNVTDLYSLFTPAMENFVNLHLDPTGCQKSEYYYKNSSLCFLCDKFDACFSFGYVKRELGKTKINPMGNVYLDGKYDNLTALHFYSSGLDKLLGCRDNLECENGIKAKIEDNIVTNLRITYNGTTVVKNNLLNGTFAVFEFPSTFSINDINSKIIKMANELGYGNETCDYLLDFIGSCSKLSILWVDNNDVIFFRY